MKRKLKKPKKQELFHIESLIPGMNRYDYYIYETYAFSYERFREININFSSSKEDIFDSNSLNVTITTSIEIPESILSDAIPPIAQSVVLHCEKLLAEKKPLKKKRKTLKNAKLHVRKPANRRTKNH